MSEASVHYGKTKTFPPRTPEEIAAYLREEHTPLANMTTREEQDKHIADLIQKYAEDYHINQLAEFGDHRE